MILSRLLRSAAGAVAALLSIASPARAARVVAARPLPAVAAAKHMLFKVRGPHATVYLLGSVHLLNAEAGKLPPEVDTAFAHAKSVAFETSIDSLPLHMNDMLMAAMYPAGQSLKSSLSPADLAKVDSVVKQYGLTLDAMDRYKPWFVSLALTSLVMQKSNFQQQFGVDVQLNERAKTANKPLIALEPVDFQIHLFDHVAPADQVKMLTMDKGPVVAAQELEKIKNAWVVGDTAKLDAIFSDSPDESPELIDKLLTQRNASWLPQIEQMLKGKDDVLVVVGAAHLVGKKGLLELLKAKGYTIEQM